MALFVISMDPAYYADSSTVEAAMISRGITIEKIYRFSLTFKINATEEQISSLSGVMYYESVLTTLTAEHTNIGFSDDVVNSWNIDHLKSTSISDISMKFKYPDTALTWQPLDQTSGSTVIIYLLDTGINKGHNELINSNIQDLYKVASVTDYTDTSGHGTAMASLIVGTNIGISASACLQNVKLFESGVGTISVGEIFDALDSVMSHHETNSPSIPKVVCMPWVVTKNQLIDSKLSELLNNNLLLVAAAGNNGNNTDVDLFTPGGLDTVITVGAHDQDFAVTAFTNMPIIDYIDETTTPEFKGVSLTAKIDVFALGTSVCVASHSAVNGYITTNGTSPATALVSGAFAHWIKLYPGATADAIKSYLIMNGHQSAKLPRSPNSLEPKVLTYKNLQFNTGKTADFRNINYAILTVIQQSELSICAIPSGRLLNLQYGQQASINIGIKPDATEIGVLDFSPLSPWMTLDLTTGIFAADTSNVTLAPFSICPGVYHFAIKGEVDGKIVVEEYSVGVYHQNISELDDVKEFYYDADVDDYEEVITYSVAPGKDGVHSKKHR
jgi:hypothetical protein